MRPLERTILHTLVTVNASAAFALGFFALYLYAYGWYDPSMASLGVVSVVLGVSYHVAGGGLLELKTQSWWLSLVTSVLWLVSSILLLVLFTDGFSLGYSLIGLSPEWPIALVILAFAIPLTVIIVISLMLARRQRLDHVEPEESG